MSGAAALLYEVVWVRLGVLLFGATAPAVATTVACFMLGLGAGGAWGGRIADRSPRPLFVYGAVELIVGGWGLVLVGLQLLGSVDDLAYYVAANDFLRVLALLVFIGPPTFVMGMSLPLLVRGLSQRPGRAPARLASLYAVNTAGAVAGTLLAGFVLVEHLGLLGTQAVAVGANLAAGIAAVALSRRFVPVLPAPSPAARPASGAQRGSSAVAPTLAVVAVAGFCSMALQVLLVRALDLLTFSTVYAFSAILAVFLTGIALGSALTVRNVERVAHPMRAGATAVGILGAWALASPAIVAVLAAGYGEDLRDVGTLGTSSSLAVVAFAVVLIPTLASGAALPLLTREFLSRRPRVGSGVGTVYFANTASGVAGSVLAGFVLIPTWGVQTSLTGIGALAVLASAVAVARTHLGGGAAIAAGGACAAALPMLLGTQLSHDVYASLDEEWQILDTADDASVSVMVARHRDTPGRMGLWVEGNYVAGTGGGHLLLGHLPMLRHGSAVNIMGACIGTGQTLGVTAQYPIEQLDLVELSPAVMGLSRKHFAPLQRNLFGRGNVIWHVDDARRFIRSQHRRYDVVTAEPLQPWTRGTVTLYSRQYYEHIRRALRPGGIAVQWSPLYEVAPEDLRGIVATFIAVFPQAELWLDYQDVILLGSETLPSFDVARLQEMMQRPEVASDLELIHITNLPTLLSRRVMGPQALARFAEGGRVITDQDPYLEMTAPRAIGRSTQWDNLRDLAAAWEVPWTGAGGDVATLSAAAAAAREGLRVELREQAGEADLTDAHLRSLAHYPHHSQVFARTAARVQRDAERAHPSSIERYQELLRLRPDFAGGWINYGRLQLRRGALAEATLAFEHAARDPEVRPLALNNLGVVQARSGNHEAARAAWSEALSLRPDDPAILRNLANLDAAPRGSSPP